MTIIANLDLILLTWTALSVALGLIIGPKFAWGGV